MTLALLVALPGSASADTLTRQQYLQRLQTARAELAAARAAVPLLRAAQVAEARALLQRTTAVVAPADGAVAVDDSVLAQGIDTTDVSLDAALGRLDARITMVSRVASPPILPSVADSRLREAVQQTAASSAPADLFDAIGRAILRFLSELRGGGPDFGLLWPALGGAGLAVMLFVIATLGRALPERVRREVFVSGAAEHERADPTTHLRAADAALAAGRSRDALHALYLYVIAALATREAIRYDPALTDRELLVRAAAIPHADSLRDLVAIHERSWFGVREPSPAEARRGRELALRVAP
jgi:hypothetical protein